MSARGPSLSRPLAASPTAAACDRCSHDAAARLSVVRCPSAVLRPPAAPCQARLPPRRCPVRPLGGMCAPLSLSPSDSPASGPSRWLHPCNAHSSFPALPSSPSLFRDPPAAAALRTRNEMWAKMQRTIRTRAKLDDDDPGWEMKIRPLALVAPFQFQSAGFAEDGWRDNPHTVDFTLRI